MTLDLRSRAPEYSTPIRRRGLFGRLLSAIATLRVRIEVARALKRYRAPRGSPHIPPYLRRDLGLPPDYSSPSHWDHQ